MDKLDELVDILQPPLFTVSGRTKTRGQAYKDGDWIGNFNLWIVTDDPEPGIVYQQRGPHKAWAPNLLDVGAAGQLLAGEQPIDGLREVEEELGKRYQPEQLLSLGRKMHVGINVDGTTRNDIASLYLIKDNSPLESYKLQASEVHALCICPVRELLRVHRDPAYSFAVKALTASGEQIEITVTQKSFPENWDNYHHKIALLVDRYFHGETELMY